MTIIYDMPQEQYFASDHFGIHALMDYKNKGAAYFNMRHITKEITEEKKSGVYAFGTAAHSLILEGENAYNECVAIKPDEYTNKKGETKKWNGNATECKEWATTYQNHCIMSKIEDYTIQGMNHAVKKYSNSSQLLSKSVSEVVIQREIETHHGPLPVQIRIDAITLDGEGRDPMHWLNLVDYKTTESLDKFSRDVRWLNYYIQAAFYRMVVEEETGLQLPWYFIAQEKTKPYRIHAAELDEESLQVGNDFLSYLLPEVAQSISTNDWPCGHRSDTISIIKN